MPDNRGPRNFFDRLEHKLSHLAIPHVLRWVGIFQVVVFVLMAMDSQYWEWIAFNRDAIFEGQVWRLFSFIFMPRSSSPLFLLVSVVFLWFLSDGLEHAWGSFRVNLYFFSTMFCLALAGLLVPLTNILSLVTYASIFLAFACLYPNQVINLMFVIPIKIKYLAWIIGGVLMLMILENYYTAAVVGLGLLPFFGVFGPGFIRDLKQQNKAASRRADYQAKVREGKKETAAFHTCAECGITDGEAPEMEFRVSDDGEEYCLTCLESRKQAEEKSASAS